MASSPSRPIGAAIMSTLTPWRSMLNCSQCLTKCGICKKEVKDRKQVVFAGVYLSQNSFCEKCGKPVAKFLNKVNKKNGKQNKR